MQSGFPCVRQQSVNDCGIACLATILQTVRPHLPLAVIRATLRQLIPVDEQGASCLALVEAARQYGLPAQGVATDWAGLKQLPLPCVAHWHGATVQHFVVVYQLTETELCLADPAQGLVNCAADEFSRRWTGTVIIFAPLPQATW